MKRLALGMFLAAVPLAANATPPAQVAQLSPQAGVEAAMVDSAAGWNAGDLARFMAVYSDAPETSFVTKTGVLRGKAVMAERYRTK